MPSPPGTETPWTSSISSIAVPCLSSLIRNSLPVFDCTTTSFLLLLATMPLRLNPVWNGIPPETSSACGVPLPARTWSAVTCQRVGRSESVT